jgi:preprotein translocase SecE subunit
MGNEARDDSNALEHAKGAWQQFEQYASEVKTETKRVTWPSMQEVYGTTVMVVLTTFLFGIYFYLCDLGFGRAVRSLLNHFLHRG